MRPCLGRGPQLASFWTKRATLATLAALAAPGAREKSAFNSGARANSLPGQYKNVLLTPSVLFIYSQGSVACKTRDEWTITGQAWYT